MAFTRIRTINGKPYLYEERRWREGGKVRSKSIYLGPGSTPRRWYQPIPDEEKGLRYIERLMEKYPSPPIERPPGPPTPIERAPAPTTEAPSAEAGPNEAGTADSEGKE